MVSQIDGIALVTGAASGIGKDTALTFAAEGAAGVVFADINEKLASEAAEASRSLATNPKYKALTVVVDVADEASVKALVAKTVETFGRIDYCVNSAGVGAKQTTEACDAPLDDVDRVYRINVHGTLSVLQQVSLQMKKQDLRTVQGRSGSRGEIRGSIVNLGSTKSLVATPHDVPYITSKHAIVGVARSAAVDLAPYGIRSNIVCPCFVDTPMIDGSRKTAVFDTIIRKIPLSRIAHSEEVADVIVFLSSPKASYVTGSVWQVDGGAAYCHNFR